MGSAEGKGGHRVDTGSNVQLLRRGYEALAAGNPAETLAMFAADAVMHVGGYGPLAGDKVGRGAIGQHLQKLGELTAGTLRLDVEEIFADESHGVVVLTERATRASDGATLNAREAHLMSLDGGAIVEFWDIPREADREAHDSFFA